MASAVIAIVTGRPVAGNFHESMVLWAGIGAWLLARWWRARQAVLRMPGGRQLLAPPPRREWLPVDFATLRRRRRAWWQPLVALYLAAVAISVIVEGIRGNPAADRSAGEPAVIGLGAVLLGAALWLLLRWLAARYVLRRTERADDAAAARRALAC